MAKKRSGGNKTTTQSSGSAPASQKGVPNTHKHVYMDTASAKKHCASDKKAIEDKCKEESASEKQKRQKSQPGFLGKLKPPAHSGKAPNPNAQWVNDHCEFLMHKPGSADEMMKEIKDLPNELAKELGTEALEIAQNKAKEKLEAAIKKKLAKMALKQGFIRIGSFLGGPVVGIAVNIAMTAAAANDIANAMKEFPDMVKEIEAAAKKLQDAQAKVADLQKQVDSYKYPPGHEKAGQFNQEKATSDVMTAAAKMNPCIRARRCALVPYKETDSKKAAKDGDGCCPGQTGHHVLPGAMFKGCPDYKHDDAPTICVEGTNNSHGSHGTAHTEMGKRLGRLTDKTGKTVPKGAPISKDEAIEAGAQSVQDAFPESGCNLKCLKAQLGSFYGKLKCTPKNESGESGGGSTSTTTAPQKTKG